MTTTSRTMRTAAAALMVASVAATTMTPVFADTAPKKQESLIDRTATGSIQPRTGPECTRNNRSTDIACRIAGDDRAPNYPSAPVNPVFGF